MTKKRNIGEELLEAVQEIQTGGGKKKRVATPDDIIAARQKLKLSQASFASLMGVSLRTLQAWEQGQRHPSGAALSLLAIASKHPRIVLGTLHD